MGLEQAVDKSFTPLDEKNKFVYLHIEMLVQKVHK
jgi:hypothetical protein